MFDVIFVIWGYISHVEYGVIVRIGIGSPAGWLAAGCYATLMLSLAHKLFLLLSGCVVGKGCREIGEVLFPFFGNIPWLQAASSKRDVVRFSDWISMASDIL